MNVRKQIKQTDEQRLKQLCPKEANKVKKGYLYVVRDRFKFDHGFDQVVDLIIAPSDGDHFNDYQKEYNIGRDGDQALKPYKDCDLTIYVVHLQEKDPETPQFTSLFQFIRKFNLEFEGKKLFSDGEQK